MFLTIKDAASLMQVSTRTIRRQIKAGSLRAIRLGAQYRLPASQFEGFEDAIADQVQRRRNAEAEAALL